MTWDNNPYDNPERFGLTLLGSLDLTEPFYSFDLLAAWKGADGIYLGTDSGCSCPTPFESYDGLKDMTGPLTPEQAIEEARNLAMKEQDYDYAEGKYVTRVFDQPALDSLVAAIAGAVSA